MTYLFIAYIAHVVEISLIGYAIAEIGPYLYLPLSYFTSAIMVTIYSRFIVKRNEGNAVTFADVLAHKGMLSAYIGGAFMGNALWFFSISMIGIGVVSFILIFIRLFVAAYAYLFMDDRYPWDKMVAFIGAFIALGFYSYNGMGENLGGIIMAFLSCFAFAAESVAKKKLAHSTLKPDRLVLWRYCVLAMLFIAAFVGALSLGLIPQEALIAPEPFYIMVMTLACFLGSIGTNLVLFYALRTTTLSTLEALNTTKPVALSAIGVFALGETILPQQILWGAVIILTSFYFIWPRRQSNATKQN